MISDNECSNSARVLVNEICVERNISEYLRLLKADRPKAFKHSMNVAYLAAEISYLLGFSKKEDIIRGALLHDLGKLYIPRKILVKRSGLTQNDWDIIHQHPIKGFEMVKDDKTLSQDVKDIILMHHEKLNGQGYPYGITDIPRIVQLVTVCDIYDALTEKRPYGHKYNMVDALEIIKHEPVNTSISIIIRSCPEK